MTESKGEWDSAAEDHSLEYASPDTPADRVGDFGHELDGLRIRQHAALRRGAHRARSYALIGGVACVVVAVQLVIMTVTHFRTRGWGAWAMGYVLFAAAALMIGIHFARRVRELSAEIRTPAPLPPPPAGGPDFSALSDGSQRWKALEAMQQEDEDQTQSQE